MHTRFDVIVVGAGIVGCACAWELSRAGCRVAVLERDTLGGGATAAGMGHLLILDNSPEQLALTRYSMQIWMEIRDMLPAAVEFAPMGTLWVACDEEEMAEVYRKHALYGEEGIACEVLDAASLAEAESMLAPDMAGALLLTNDSLIYPPAAAKYFLNQALLHGCKFFPGSDVVALGGGEVRLRDGSRFICGNAVNAAGLDALALDSGIVLRPRKGHLVITDRYPGLLRHAVVELGYLKSAHTIETDSVAFNAQPRATGQILIGSSRQFDDLTWGVDRAMLGRMMARAVEYMPGLAACSVLRAWTGWRAATPDHLPLIGPAVNDAGVLLATGHEGFGITTATATARLLTDHVLQQASAIPREPYLPARLKAQVANA
jgi:D-hydroxyproline dehydrogenase subunit beta